MMMTMTMMMTSGPFRGGGGGDSRGGQLMEELTEELMEGLMEGLMEVECHHPRREGHHWSGAQQPLEESVPLSPQARHHHHWRLGRISAAADTA